MSVDLAAVAAFTRARLGELEAVASAATPGEWFAHEGDIRTRTGDRYRDQACVASAEGADAVHIAVSYPGHALRLVTFGRALLGAFDHLAKPGTLVQRVTFPALTELAAGILLDFAQIWEKHPEFKTEEWKLD